MRLVVFLLPLGVPRTGRDAAPGCKRSVFHVEARPERNCLERDEGCHALRWTWCETVERVLGVRVLWQQSNFVFSELEAWGI